MNDTQKAAYIQAMAASALIEAMGMQGSNALAQETGQPIHFAKADFDALIEKYGIHHNAVLEYLRS